MKTNIVKNVKAGFSLVEMLVVIAVIGIIAAIAVPTIGNITEQANNSKAKRNAQNLASVCPKRKQNCPKRKCNKLKRQ